MSDSIAILGRQPALGTAELESLLGADSLRSISEGLVYITKDRSEVPFQRLGGTVKLAKVLVKIDSTDWKDIVKHLHDNLPNHLHYFEGKIRLGLNVYGLNVNTQTLNRTGLELKKLIKNAGRSVRVVPNKGKELNSAQTLHNQLTGPSGLELVFVKDGNATWMAQVTQVQDIDAYAARDQARPKRDAKVGMLPPKLAQIIINVAADQNETLTRLLDPFCGTGVLLQETLLMGYEAYGTDLEPRMIEYSQANLEWLREKHETAGSFALEVGDATTHTWEQPVDLIACETYLGKPLAYLPKPDILHEVIAEADQIHTKFLQNVARQTKPGFRMTIAVPAWKINTGFKHLKTLAKLEELGYTRMSFVHANNKDLIYHRENQIVARELVVLERK